MKLTLVDWIAVILTVVGGINWGLIGAFNLNVVDQVTGGEGNIITRVIYIVVGLSALYLIYTIGRSSAGSKQMSGMGGPQM
ncbi:MAG: DUF378 domain-containing protein [Candidatus Paceibacterota bacterium]